MKQLKLNTNASPTVSPKKKKIARYMSSGTNSLSHTHSEAYIKYLQQSSDDQIPIAVNSYLVEHNFPHNSPRQLTGLALNISNKFKTLYQRHQTFPLFLILGFSVNIRAKHGDTFGRTQDKHSIALSILQGKNGFTLEVFDANGPLDNSTYQFDNKLLELIQAIKQTLITENWFPSEEIYFTQFPNQTINFGAGHCDLLAISYVAGRNDNSDTNTLLKSFDEFSSYTTPQREIIIKNITELIVNKNNIVRNCVPRSFKLPLIELTK